MLGQSAISKYLIKITRDFTAEQHDELSVGRGDIAQFVEKPEPYWYQVYLDGNVGKLPTSSCIEFNSNQLATLRLCRSEHRAFVAKFNFRKSEDTDLAFSCYDILIGFNKSNDDWWYGTRLEYVFQDSERQLFVKARDCGIFPLNHVWQLRDDLLPDYVFNSVGIQVLASTNDNNNNSPPVTPSTPTNQPSTTPTSTTILHNNNSNPVPTKSSSKQKFLFYVKVTKTLKAELPEEIELPSEGEVLGVISVQDKLYYLGQSLDGLRQGIFPKKFVEIIENYEEDNEDEEDDEEYTPNNCDMSSNSSEFGASPIPPSIPPPSPPNLEKEPKDNTTTTAYSSRNYQPQLSDSPPSYDFAVNNSNCYGYVDNMFSEVSPYGRVLYDFHAQFENELTLSENQIVHLIRHLDQGWTEGELNGTVGIFPTSYITIIVDCEAYAGENANASAAATSSTVLEEETNANQVEAIDYPANTKAKILSDYDGKMEQDLKVHVGDIVTLLRRFSSTNWVEAMDCSGNVGFVYLDFCEILDPEPSVMITTSGGRYCNITSGVSQSEPEPPEIPKHNNITKNNYEDTSHHHHQIEPSKEDEDGFSVKPRRRAPQAPRGGANIIFPTFNQFVHNEKLGLHDPDGEHQSKQHNKSSKTHSSATTNHISHQPDQSSSSQIKSKDEKSQDKSRRECIITELIQTERDYCHAMNVCVRAFELTQTEADRCSFSIEKMFTELRAVIVVSKNILKLLDNYANNRAFVDQRVGFCFLELKTEIEEAYTRYCRNHDSVNSRLKMYEGDQRSNKYIKSCLLEIQRQTNCFDISSILIKPVQRILKYPLLLNELIKCTEPSHIDCEQLPSALQMITDIANNINEHKRRQDLIQKYCKVRDPSLGERLKNLNMHTVKKKSYRFGYRFFSTLTFSNGAKDEVYGSALEKFIITDKTIKNFITRLTTYLQHLQNYYEHSLIVAEEISNYYDNKRNPQVGIDELRMTLRKIHSEYFRQFKTTCERDVIGMLLKLVDKFAAPFKLIEKREDKRIDFEASIKSNKNAELTEKTFTALNQQLVEELPKLTEASTRIFANCLQTYLAANKKLSGLSTMVFLELSELPFIKNVSFAYFDDIEENFRVKHNLIFQKIVQELSLLHSNVFQNGASSGGTLTTGTSTLNRFQMHRSSNTWKNAIPINKTQPSSSSGSTTTAANNNNPSHNCTIAISNEKIPQTESQKRWLESKFNPNDLYQVNGTYEPYDLHELYVQKYDLVGVIKRQDPMGLGHRWFVDRGEKFQGFLPQKILSLYQSPHQQLQQKQQQKTHSFVEVTETPSTSFYQNIGQTENIAHYYDTVPGEHDSSQPQSLLSFDEIDNSLTPTHNPQLDDITSTFDPLFSTTATTTQLRPSSQQTNSTNSRPNSIASNDSSNLSNSSTSMSQDNYYHAVYPFETSDPNQISLSFGQRVLVLHKSDTAGNPEWWFVRNQSGQQGYAPANYLTQLGPTK